MLRLADRTLAPVDLVSEATTCFKTRLPDSKGWDYVVKFKWRLRDNIAAEPILQYTKK